MSRFLTGEALKKETFKQLVYTVQKSSKKRNSWTRKKINSYDRERKENNSIS